MTPKFKFAEGEKVLCFHGPLIYEAKALKSQVTKEKVTRYYIHYAGWNKNWDEWVPENRVLKYNEVNVQRQREVSKQHSSLSARKKRKKSDGTVLSKDSDSRASTPSKELLKDNPVSTPTAPSTSGRSRSSKPPSINTPNVLLPEPKDETPRRKRGRNENSTSIETEDMFITKVEVKIKIPDELKPCLVDDWDAITRQHKLIEIPAKITIQNIIDSYIAYKKSSKTLIPTKEIAINDVANGLIEYFNVMLGSQLLYKFERPQYADVLQAYPKKLMTDLYGGFHFLRLFVKLGSMLAFTTLDEKSIQILLGHMNDILKFLVKNSSTYFSMSSFINASSEYHRKTQ